MKKKQLYMIGNSHIDPVWFWNWEEGMQEVKATYASVLDRMREFVDFKFTSTSTAFFSWIEIILPEMFEEIKQRVAEGRWEITGGWFIEPDCILPNGESFVRQGLYGQRYLKDRFGVISKIGSNVDSFGHNHILPQILKKSGMDAYVFMRPRQDTPVFVWESDDGSQVNAISLPAEYTTWFHGPTLENIETTLKRTKSYDRMPCCFGVGNHGGGPTIENIKSIQSLKNHFKDVELDFSTFTQFLEDSKEWELPIVKGAFEKVNVGCYSIDAKFKQLNRLAETRLMEADSLMSMAKISTGQWIDEFAHMKWLWNVLHFNQFHDTMGGTTIKSAREEAIMQLSGVCAKSGFIKALATQQICNSLDTNGEGFPLVLFNTGSQPYEGEVEIEVEWFCQSPMMLVNPQGEEIPYQRLHTDAKIRHTVLGGRRRFIFLGKIPSFGYAVYRLLKEETTMSLNLLPEIDDSSPYILENNNIRAKFDEHTGMLCSLVDKISGYDSIKGTSSIRVFLDERDDWGGLQGKRYEDLNQSFVLESIDKVESGPLRARVRVRLKYEDTRLEQLFTLGAEEEELRVECRLCFQHRWTLLKMAYPVGGENIITRAETAYGTLIRTIRDEDEYYMQRFLDVSNEEGEGLAIANDGTYAFNLAEGRVQVTLVRSAIYAQGDSPDWYNEAESYQYTDIGMHTFSFALKPHGQALESEQLYRIAKKVNGPYEFLFDSIHEGEKKATVNHFASVSKPNVEIMLIKKAEDDNGIIIRLLETAGEDTEFTLRLSNKEYKQTIGHNEIMTLKVQENGYIQSVNLIEWLE